MYGVLVWKSEGNRRLLRRLSWEGNIKMYLPEMGLGGTMLPAGGRQHRGCIIPQALTHTLVLLKMGVIIARNMLS